MARHMYIKVLIATKAASTSRIIGWEATSGGAEFIKGSIRTEPPTDRQPVGCARPTERAFQKRCREPLARKQRSGTSRRRVPGKAMRPGPEPATHRARR